jgi:hypothetical protein
MRRVFFAVALGVGMAALVGPSRAYAFGDENLVVKVPFTFEVEGVQMPAGQYMVRQADIADPQVVEIRSEKTGQGDLFLTVDGYPAHSVKSPKLVFDREGGQEVLHAIWLPDASGAVFEARSSVVQVARAAMPATKSHTRKGR